MGEGTAVMAESHPHNSINSRGRTDRHMLQVFEEGTLGARMPRHAGMPPMQGGRDIANWNAQADKGGMEVQRTQTLTGKGGCLATGSK